MPGANRVIIEWVMLGVLLVALTVAATRQQWFWRADQVIYDAALRQTLREPPNDIVIVAIDEAKASGEVVRFFAEDVVTGLRSYFAR